MDKNLELVKNIISKIIYVTVATVSSDGKPWNTPVYSAFDEQYNFYWVSGRETEHSKNILNNGEVFVVIYDSTVAEGTGKGVYISAKAYELNDEAEINNAAKYLYGRKNKAPRPLSAYTQESPRRIYKAVPKQVWLNSSNDINGHPVDSRVEVNF